MSILDEIHKIIVGNAELFTCIGFLAGTLLGNWLAIGQEKRKEFNQIADPLSEALTQVREFSTCDNTLDFFMFKRVLNRWELFRFNKCLKNYERAKEKAEPEPYDNSGIILSGGRYKDTKDIVAAIDKLLTFTKRR